MNFIASTTQSIRDTFTFIGDMYLTERCHKFSGNHQLDGAYIKPHADGKQSRQHKRNLKHPC
ncbi:hypothetical protein QFX18_13970 [Saccharophagus degradans]|uniref:hypothetical protein n=1 Tax=Saccharophagus degradans TaxID=86304 RepID=UPI002477F511|nr:hypothetical protein [Saccharophagus degradans]WGO97148.1 hypothetical protein QFX18_13970 [Saccharophagus degradans]